MGLDESNLTVNKKIRNAQLAGWNYIFVVGEQEVEQLYGAANVRDQDRTF